MESFVGLQAPAASAGACRRRVSVDGFGVESKSRRREAMSQGGSGRGGGPAYSVNTVSRFFEIDGNSATISTMTATISKPADIGRSMKVMNEPREMISA